MEPKNLTVEILKQIRDNTAVNSERIDALGNELATLREETNQRIEALQGGIEGVSGRLVSMEVRLATELTTVNGTLREFLGEFRNRRSIEARMERCEADIAELKRAP